jgi:hypothetical protein
MARNGELTRGLVCRPQSKGGNQHCWASQQCHPPPTLAKKRAALVVFNQECKAAENLWSSCFSRLRRTG